MTRRIRPMASLGLAALVLLGAARPAHAGLLDSLFGPGEKSSVKAQQGQREWLLHDFTTIRLAAREAGAPPNQHPQSLDAENLRRLLASVRSSEGGRSDPLFSAEELGELVEPLLQAFESAGPNDDLLLLSSSRRGGLLLQPLALTARLFVQAGQLQLIVNDTRLEFMNRYIGTRQPPVFSYGSRNAAGRAALRSEAARSVRPDWLALALAAAPEAGAAAAKAPASAMPAAAPAMVVAPAAAAVAPTPNAAPATSPAAAPSADIEQRLLLLKRLRDKGLISEEEYVQKRKEILSSL